MTWAEWVDSEYNTYGYVAEEGKIHHPLYSQELIFKDSQSVSSSDIIIANTAYSIHGAGFEN